MTISVYGTLIAASLVLLLGSRLVGSIPFLRAYTIPEPVAGGLVAAVILLLMRAFGHTEVRFDTSVQTPLMLAFFATVGLNANLARLRSGGPLVLRFLAAVVGLLLVQNMVGLAMSHFLHINPLFGLIAGTITLSGGHGTGAAWGKVFTNAYGLHSATEVAMACATFGLVMGGIIGGPVARVLMRRVARRQELHATNMATNPKDVITNPALSRAVNVDGPSCSSVHAPDGHAYAFEEPTAEQPTTPSDFISTLALIAISLACGQFFSSLLGGTEFALPTFVCVLFVGVVLSNLLSLAGKPIAEHAVALLGNVSLALFLAMALMTLNLWELASLALPIMTILAVQTVVMALYAIFVTFRVMGSDYDAVVLSAGHCGFGLGATPTAIANMQAVTSRFGHSHVAFLVVPMVGAFFIDLVNAIVIKGFLILPIFQ